MAATLERESPFDPGVAGSPPGRTGGKLLPLSATAGGCLEPPRGEDLGSRAFEEAPNGIVVTDVDGRVIGANAAFYAAVSLDRAELAGRNLWELVTDRQGGDPSSVAEASLARAGRWAGPVWLLQERGPRRGSWLTISVVEGRGAQPPRRVAVWTDLVSPHDRARELEQLAFYDPVTGLPNRTLFQDRLLQAIHRARRSGQPLAVFFLDLDGFKRVNDALGHRVGDLLMAEVGRRLASGLRASDTVARIGGDEFSVVLPDVEPADAALVARKMLAAVAAPFQYGPQKVAVSASIGIAVFPADAESPDELLALADEAMYESKGRGPDGYRFYSRTMHARSLAQLRLECDLRRALEDGCLNLHYQPQLDVRTGRIAAVEALVRWHHPRLGTLPPARFLPIAREAGLLAHLGDWVMRRAFGRARAWRDAGGPPLRMAVNVSAEQLGLPDAVDRVAAALIDSRLEPRFAELEITESVAMANPERTAETLMDLRALGVRVAIDDFGTGYSSLSYLQRFPLGALKVDRTFVQGVDGDPDAASIVSIIVALARKLGLEVVAEGVETRGQLDVLVRAGCDLVQGFLLGRPIPEVPLRALLASGSQNAPPPSAPNPSPR
ncbi:MAG: EAL domain-containing protein [Deltaproteobacteria bacterium]|nr:EAL domain-containing protein [Deltaproteobacteria bacterium]